MANPPTEDKLTDELVAILCILRDYENLALGVRNNIIDEIYLYRWMRGLILKDWSIFSAFVTAVRSKYNQRAYIEFEGLAAAWEADRSYYTNKKIHLHHRKIIVR